MTTPTIEARPTHYRRTLADGTVEIFQAGPGGEMPTFPPTPQGYSVEAVIVNEARVQEVLKIIEATLDEVINGNAEGAKQVFASLVPVLRSLAASENPWRAAIDEALLVNGLDCTGGKEQPMEALARLIKWETECALDPAISSAAQALIDKGASATQVPQGWEALEARVAALESQVTELNARTMGSFRVGGGPR